MYCYIKNPSFEEDISSHSLTPKEWKNCGDNFESSIDIHTSNGWFQVRHSPVEGGQFAGMVVRDNQTREAIGQILDATLYGGTTYAFSFYVARAQDYISLSKTTLKEENFNKPALLKVKIGDDCTDMEIVGQTNLIESTEWERYMIIFTPSVNSDFLVLEAFYEDDFAIYNGNILLDNISPIVELPSKK